MAARECAIDSESLTVGTSGSPGHQPTGLAPDVLCKLRDLLMDQPEAGKFHLPNDVDRSNPIMSLVHASVSGSVKRLPMA